MSHAFDSFLLRVRKPPSSGTLKDWTSSLDPSYLSPEMGSCFRVKESIKEKRKRKKPQTTTTGEQPGSGPSSNEDQHVHTKLDGFFSNLKGKRVELPQDKHLAHDAASVIFKQVVAGDTFISTTLGPKTSQLTRGLGFVVHSLDTYIRSFPMFRYRSGVIDEWNQLPLGASRLRECLKTISNDYIRGVLSEEMPLYVLETDLLAACACAKTIQSRYSNEHIGIVILDTSSLDREGALVSASHAFNTLRVPTPSDFEDKMLVWAEQFDRVELFRPLKDAEIHVIDWRRLQLNKIGLEWFTELRRSPEISTQPTSTELYKRWLDRPQLFQSATLPVTEMLVELWALLEKDVNDNYTQQLARTLVMWSTGFVKPDDQDPIDLMTSAGRVDEALAQLLLLQADKYAERAGNDRVADGLQMHIVEEIYVEWKDQERQAREASAAVKRQMSSAIDDAWQLVEQQLVEHKRIPVGPGPQDVQTFNQHQNHGVRVQVRTPDRESTTIVDREETERETDVNVFHEALSSPRVDSLAPKSSVPDLQASDDNGERDSSREEEGEEEVDLVLVDHDNEADLTSVDEEEAEEPVCAVAIEGNIMKPLLRHSVSRDTPTRLGSRVPGAF
jgi:hypothetical protein